MPIKIGAVDIEMDSKPSNTGNSISKIKIGAVDIEINKT